MDHNTDQRNVLAIVKQISRELRFAIAVRKGMDLYSDNLERDLEQEIELDDERHIQEQMNTAATRWLTQEKKRLKQQRQSRWRTRRLSRRGDWQELADNV